MRNICLTAMTLAIHCIYHAQGWLPAGARSLSMAGSTVALSDAWSHYHNPGATAFLEQASAGLSYENRFLLRELQTQSLAFAHPLRTGVISAGVQSYGYKLFRSTRIGAGYALLLGEKVAAGVQLNYQGIRIDQYGSKATATAEAGMLVKMNARTSIGASVMNIGRSKLADFRDERFASVMRLGLCHRASDKVIVLADAEKKITAPVRVRGGMEYELVRDFFTRAGAACNPAEVTFGFGYRSSGRLSLDLGSAWQQLLGWSPHFGLTYDLKPARHE